jgi:hypothetical protein
MDKTPSDKIPTSPMPKTTHQKDNKGISNSFEFTIFGTSKWYVKVIPEPR